MIRRIHWLGNAAFYIEGSSGIAIYIDPYNLKRSTPKADIIFISHGHFDHCSPKDIKKILKVETVVVAAPSVVGKVDAAIKIFHPGEHAKILDIDIEAIPAYNVAKEFHKQAEGNLGFIITVDGTKIYHAGDTDLIPEMRGVKADIALLPIGGTYTMDAMEAAKAADAVEAKMVVPMHYGGSLSSDRAAFEFQKLCRSDVHILTMEA